LSVAPLLDIPDKSRYNNFDFWIILNFGNPMKLTRRQEAFIRKLPDVYREAGAGALLPAG
jgi:hypothetical protein